MFVNAITGPVAKPLGAAASSAVPPPAERQGPAPAREAAVPSFAPAPPPSQTLRALVEAQAAKGSNAAGLTEQEQALVAQLKARDREVRDHEQAHARVGGSYAGAPTYTYQSGPDGNRYAIGGEVAIDVAPVDGDPEATIEKMEIVKAAALAPAEPSGQDRKVAALADAQKMQAIADLAELRRAVNEGPVDRRLDLVA